jgi:UDP:flavonoid glycosyltransferase YjiC (YdhE family)
VGIVAEPVPGHLNPALAIGRELRARGHDVVLFGIADVAERAAASGLRFATVGERELPPGALRSRWLSPAHTRGARGLLGSIRLHVEETEVLCRDVVAHVREDPLDVLMVDQLQVCGRYLADATGATLVTVCAGPGVLRLDDGSFPPPFVDRAPSRGKLARALNTAGFAGMWLAAAPRIRVTNRHARSAGLPVRRALADLASPHVQICALVPELNFGVVPPAGSPLRYVGPLVDDRRPAVPFPWERLDGRPLVYASLGTVQDRAEAIFAVIAEACAPLPVQLVVTLGDELGGRPRPELPGDPIVVSHAPQLDLLDRASLCITHCGMNTTMEAAAAGVPLVGIPITYDQPAVAARIRHAGLGRTIPYQRLDVAGLRAAVSAVLAEPGYRARAAAVAASCRRSGGPAAAADAVEAASGLTAERST